MPLASTATPVTESSPLLPTDLAQTKLPFLSSFQTKPSQLLLVLERFAVPEPGSGKGGEVDAWIEGNTVFVRSEGIAALDVLLDGRALYVTSGVARSIQVLHVG